MIEYNWYAHRAIEGYYLEEGRGGAGYTAFNINKVESLPTVPEEGVHSNEELWKNITYFLQAVIPTCEQSNVRLALHPERSPDCGHPGIGTDYGFSRRLEEVDHRGEQPGERHYLRMRRIS